MAGWLILLYLVVIAGLFGVAIYEHTTASSLFLPVSSTLTVLAILLPVLSLCNTIYYHQSSSSSSSAQSSPLSLPPPGNGPSSSSSLTTPTPTKKITLPGTLQFTQAALTIFLLATFFSISTSGEAGPLTECLLSSKWKSLWTTHNAEAIRKIQDQLVCCGFRSVKDMAWPFPSGNPEDGKKKHVDCVARYGRHESCMTKWEGELNSLVGGEMGVLVFTGFVQFLGWYFAGRVNKPGSNSGGIGEILKGIWRSVVVRLGQHGERRHADDWGTEDATDTGRGRDINGGRGGRGGRGSRLLVSGGEVERLVEVDDDDESTGEREIDRDVESGRNGYGTAGTGTGTGTQGNVWRSG
ncbi:hypothetical protein V8F33_001923 [Rhypophila sp. PSN 637]